MNLELSFVCLPSLSFQFQFICWMTSVNFWKRYLEWILKCSPISECICISILLLAYHWNVNGKEIIAVQEQELLLPERDSCNDSP